MNKPDDAPLRRTPLAAVHEASGARMVPFCGWHMPVQYPEGILAEHLWTRRSGGLFDVSHMGRFWFSGAGAEAFLDTVLTHDVSGVRVGRAQYNILAYADGGTVDDCYLYRLGREELLLVVNAANLAKDRDHLEGLRADFSGPVEMSDRSGELAMLALQGPAAERALRAAMARLGIRGELPPARRNTVGTVSWDGAECVISRTGYTGEPVCFELFVPAARAAELWAALLQVEDGAIRPIGLGARNTLRSEAGLSLYGDELSSAISGMAAGVHHLAIRVIDSDSRFLGRKALLEEYLGQSGRRIHRFLLEGRGRTPQAGDDVWLGDERAGHVTSATAIPYWTDEAAGESSVRRIGFALLDRPARVGLSRGLDRRYGDRVEIRRSAAGRTLEIGTAELVAEHGRVEGDRFVPVAYPPPERDGEAACRARAAAFARGAADNHAWRQTRAINLIASENTPSPFVRWACDLDPAGRYAEHQRVGLGELYYYQGTDWIRDVEQRLVTELRLIFGCNNVEPRAISGQMANETVFEAMVRFVAWKRRRESRVLARLSSVFNNSLALGGHLSSQGSGALYNYVEVDAQGRPALTPFPVREDYPYAIDTGRLEALIHERKPELMIFGKSMIIEPEPIAQARRIVDSLHPEERPVIMYDMAHVLGLCGPGFQEPFSEGADIVTGSTHKTFFGPQRGIVLTDIDESFGRRRFLWRFMQRAVFPGATSNHHLGTLQGLLAAALEWRAFGAAYREAIHDNARAFARALADCGVAVEGDASRGYTQTHQVLVDVGPGRAREVARALEDDGIVCNFQGLPGDESFSASRGLRLGVQEMTRFGMGPAAFGELAALMADRILRNKSVAGPVVALRERFSAMSFCFDRPDV